ncbi:MAG: LemA family protein [Lunatimonas sp.]|uniref:LemA family protein n=1 Tax=Lunatimonas sp. TaxID=2060141 RepID=UPI00263B6BBE|nr:LemA family protein [Lunatimonas sp.]MCC5937333.1 LemA family protein [Lunatimonas sp.]
MNVSLILAAAVILAIIFIYNQLIRLRNLAREGWSGIDVQLKRRADLVPNLVSVVKAYASHEKALFEEVTRIRSEALRPHSVEEQGESEAALTQSLRKLLVVAEAYPELKANQNFLELQQELSSIENTLQKARRYYNGTVRELNTKIETFPQNLIAKLFSFHKEPFFSLSSEAERSTPEINL